MREPRIAVVGAGAAGLTSAYRLLEAGFSVTVFARDLPPNTTSDVAAAFWSPSAIEGGARQRAWAFTGYEAFTRIAEPAGSGIEVLELYNLYPEPVSVPDLAPAATARRVEPGVFAAPWSGYGVPVPRVDVPVYMPWLLQRVTDMGGRIVQAALGRLEDVPAEYAAAINCSGLGAGQLSDDDVFPIRGQVMRVRKPAGLPEHIIHTESPGIVTYIVPRSGDCLLGGTYQYHESSMDINEAIAEAIRERCSAFYPELAQAEVLQHRVGLRPGRTSVRLETGRLSDGRPVIHNYGHGSIGHTLSWGCAEEVVELVRQATTAVQ